MLVNGGSQRDIARCEGEMKEKLILWGGRRKKAGSLGRKIPLSSGVKMTRGCPETPGAPLVSALRLLSVLRQFLRLWALTESQFSLSNL